MRISAQGDQDIFLKFFVQDVLYIWMISYCLRQDSTQVLIVRRDRDFGRLLE